MIDFADSSVIIAASTPSDPRSQACRDLLAEAKPKTIACSVHTLAEVFSVLSGRPRPVKVPPLDAALIVAHVRRALTIIELSDGEYLKTIEAMARLGHSGGMIYDALLMVCARKVKARRIYTLNETHFRMVAPDLASRIRTP